MRSWLAVVVSLIWVSPFFAMPAVAKQAQWRPATRTRSLWLLFALGISLDLGVGLWMLFGLNAEPPLRAVAAAICALGGAGLNVWSLGAAMDMLRRARSDGRR